MHQSDLKRYRYSLLLQPFTFGGSGGISIVEKDYPTVLRVRCMATRSGHGYKHKPGTKAKKAISTMAKEKTVQELMQMLVEDRRKREDEIAAERIRREEEIATERAKQGEEQKTRERQMQAKMDEIAAERARRETEIAAERARREKEIADERASREEERKLREREMQLQMDDMRVQMEKLMKVVADSKATPVTKIKGELSGVKLVPLSERDDIEAYLVTFERVMEAHKVEKDRWAHYLAPQLTGKAQLAFAAVPTTESSKYESIKAAILQRYDINEEAYRRRFRTTTRGAGETNREYAVKLMDLQRKWLREHSTSVEQMQEAIGLEQFLNSLPVEKRVWVYEKKPKTCIQAGELADEYDQVRKQDAGVVVQASSRSTSGRGSGSGGHPGTASAARVEAAGGTRPQPKRSGLERVKCFGCGELGHVKSNCPNKTATRRVMFCKEELESSGASGVANGVRRCGLVEGQEVQDILLDTGCTRTMVHADLVPPEKILEGDTVTIKCAHGDIVLYPLANVDLEVDGRRVSVEAAVSGRLPVDVLLGKDVPEFDQLLGSVEASSASTDGQEEAMVVVTRAQARKDLEAELLRREKELLAGANPTPVDGEQEKVAQLTKDQKRQLRQQCQEGERGEEELNQHSLELSAEELRALQEKDLTLSKVREAADGHPCSAGTGFFRRGGLLYRKWTPPGRGEESEVEQLVLPQECRSTVLAMAHEIPLAGHLGKAKRRQRILRRFYWPTLYKDVPKLCHLPEVGESCGSGGTPHASTHNQRTVFTSGHGTTAKE